MNSCSCSKRKRLVDDGRCGTHFCDIACPQVSVYGKIGHGARHIGTSVTSSVEELKEWSDREVRRTAPAAFSTQLPSATGSNALDLPVTVRLLDHQANAT